MAAAPLPSQAREGSGEAATSDFAPLFGDPREGKGEAAPSDFVPLFRDPRKEELSGYGVACFTFFSPVFGRFLPRVGVFSRFSVFFCFFMVVLGTNASCGTKEALFFEYFWHSLFLRRLLAECFFAFFPHA